jgi:hypothetical protein
MVDEFRVDMARAKGGEATDRDGRDLRPDAGFGHHALCALNELSQWLLDCTMRAAPRKALTRSAAMAHRHSTSQRRILAPSRITRSA